MGIQGHSMSYLTSMLQGVSRVVFLLTTVLFWSGCQHDIDDASAPSTDSSLSFPSTASLCEDPSVPIQALGQSDALLVVGNHPSQKDNAVLHLMENAGLLVERITVDESNPTDAQGKAIVVIADSAGALASKFVDVRVPLLVLDYRAYAELGLTGPVANTDFGFASNQKNLQIVASGHPLAAGYTGSVDVVLNRLKLT